MSILFIRRNLSSNPLNHELIAHIKPVVEVTHLQVENQWVKALKLLKVGLTALSKRSLVAVGRLTKGPLCKYSLNT